MKFFFASIALMLCFALPSAAQEEPSERRDSLDAAVFTAGRGGGTLSKFRDAKVETINQAGIHKMACCNLAESFENSASVTVGYSDATTGARQIRLLGLSGIYTQMLDENRPVMRGLASPFGLNFIPGSWMESIQVAKGASSVINGGESVTGTINVEHRKPTDEIPLFVNFSSMADTKTDFNVASSLQMGDNWSTVLLGHVSGNFMTMDGNGDGFADEPAQKQFNLANRWQYYSPGGVEFRFGVRALKDMREGGELHSDTANPWTTDIVNENLDLYFKLGIPFTEDGGTSFAVIGDWSHHGMDSRFGGTTYDATQNSGFLNLIYQYEFNEENRLSIGASGTLDSYGEALSLAPVGDSRLWNGGLYGEYTLHSGDALSLIAALRGDWYSGVGFKALPRISVRWTPVKEVLVLRAGAGRGLRFSTPVMDNIGALSTGKAWGGSFGTHTLEDAWTGGASATWYFPFMGSYLSFDWFKTYFREQKLVRFGANTIDFYDLSSVAGGRSYTDSYQADFYIEPAERLNLTATFRYTDARMTMPDGTFCEKPMTSRYKGVLNLQYALPLRKWIFDFTASINGPARKWDFMGGGLTPVYPLYFAQVTRRFKGLEIYVGGENLAGFRQKDVIIGTPWTSGFDASQVWGPLMGAKYYAGLRLTIWKKE